MPQSRAHGDLLGAVGMAVEARLADEELDAASDLCRRRLDLLAHALEPGTASAHGRLRDSGRGAVLAEHLAQRAAPLARGDAYLGAGDRRLHYVATFLGRAFQVGECGLDGLGVARC